MSEHISRYHINGGKWCRHSDVAKLERLLSESEIGRERVTRKLDYVSKVATICIWGIIALLPCLVNGVGVTMGWWLQ